MEQINILDKEKVQNRLNKYFNSFREERINGVPFNIMPLKEEVPLIKQVSYNKEKDIFEIVFEYKAAIRLNRQGDVIFIEDAQGRLVGIQILKLKQKDIKAITVEIISTLDKVIQAARVNLEEEFNPKMLARVDLEERKTDFLKEVLKEDLPKIVK